MTERVYLDWNATAPLRPEARLAFVDALAVAGQPLLGTCRGACGPASDRSRAGAGGGPGGGAPGDVFFTSGGTEANMLALSPAIETAGEKRPREVALISAIEHSSVRAGGRFPREGDPGRSPSMPMGASTWPRLRMPCPDAERPLVSLMLANNETGVVQPVAQAAAIVHAAGGLLHVDAVQAAGRIPCAIAVLGADLLTLSAHKIGGPEGHRRAGTAQRGHSPRRSPDQWRRARARHARRHREYGRYCRFRRGRRMPPRSSAQKRPPACWRYGTCLKTASAPSRRRR